jgi:hypothetical protein
MEITERALTWSWKIGKKPWIVGPLLVRVSCPFAVLAQRERHGGGV